VHTLIPRALALAAAAAALAIPATAAAGTGPLLAWAPATAGGYNYGTLPAGHTAAKPSPSPIRAARPPPH